MASFSCLFGAVTVTVPSFAAEGTATAGSATAMLAAVTAPLLAVDVNTLQNRDQDFSTAGQASGSPITPQADDAAAAIEAPQTLEDMVADREAETTGDEQGDCLASSVYFESKGEPLNGQLAVAQTIINRTASGRFPSTVCGVVHQPGQFSFLRRGEIPTASHSSSAWKRAVAVATIARNGLWKQIAPAALFFHARRVSPGWGKVKVASLGNHIFFR
ncbi:cell wall hydrolase [Sphingomonas abietis]|uniref:Cell wall hydrolase n=1 Tax=Sphingomonas abietis TaxID=3012344 RepID=A0ABY7NSZ6_9SPHN|nr:cell wall hydrolase [Sphingomonas abietis]WBO22596.1 cell wall hydrolase [Sphingomonas abietis]